MKNKDLFAAVAKGELDLTQSFNYRHLHRYKEHIEFLKNRLSNASQSEVESISEELAEWENMLPDNSTTTEI